MIKFCPIVPVSMLDYCDEFQQVMVLAQLYRDNATYRKYYLDQRSRWDYMVLDNGEAEGAQISSQELYDIAAELIPTVVIAPDTFRNRKETLRKTVEFITKYHYLLEQIGVDIMGVPQGETPHDFLASFAALQSLSEVNWLGVNKLVPPCRTEYLAFDEYHIFENCRKNVHLLGLSNPVEGYFARQYPCIQYIDSAIPINYGYQLKELPFDFGDRGKISSSTQFFSLPQPHADQWAMIRSNIDQLQEWL